MSRIYVKKILFLLFYMLVSLLGIGVTVLFLGREYATEDISIAAGLAAAAAGAIIAAGVCSLKKGKWIGHLIIALSVAAYVRFTFDKTAGGMAYVINNLIEEINDYYGGGLFYIYLTEDMVHKGNQQMFIGLVSFLAAYGYMYVLLKGKNGIVLAALALVSYFLPATLENEPGFAVFAADMVFVFCVLVKNRKLHGRPVRKNEKAVIQAMILMMVLTGLVLVFASVIRPRDEYVQSMAMSDLRGQAVFTVEDFRNFSFEDWKLSGVGQGTGSSISAGSLGKTAGIEYNDEPLFLVYAPKNAGTIYLKAYQAEIYSKRQWENFDDKVYEEYADDFEYIGRTDFSPYTQTTSALDCLTRLDGMGAGYISYDLDVIRYMGDEYSYIPMDATEADGQDIDMLADYDRALRFAESDEGREDAAHRFTVTAWQKFTDLDKLAVGGIRLLEDDTLSSRMSSFGSLPEEYFAAERLYQDFVYDNYLEVNTPCKDRILEELIPELVRGDYNPDTGEGKARFIEDTIAYFKENYTYTLKPGTAPADRDFVEYFLFQAKKGYCTYFATAAVMVLRSAGIPARYAEGYVIPESLYKKESVGNRTYSGWIDGRFVTENWDYYPVEVTDRYAHAWVEIYLDGIGWVIVDPTPGYASFPGSSRKEENVETSQTVAPGETESETESTEEITKTDTMAETGDEPEETAGTLDQHGGGQNGNGQDAQNQEETGSSGQAENEEVSWTMRLKETGNRILPALKSIGCTLLAALKIIAVPAAIILFFIFRQKYMEQKRNKLYNQNCGLDQKQRIERILRYFGKLMRYDKKILLKNESYAEYFARQNPEDTDMLLTAELIEKTLYSGKEPAEAEVVQILDFVAKQRRRLYQSMRWYEKLFFKYMLVY